MSGSGWYLPGSEVIVKAVPVEGYEFSGWYDGETLLSSALEYVFSASSDVSLRAASVIASGTCYNNLTWILDESGLLSISGKGRMDSWSINNKAPWYGHRNMIEMVVIGSSVTSIGDYAFYDCASLRFVDIPDSVTSVGDYAFFECTSLQSVDIPNSVVSIDYYAFYNCASLRSVTIPDSVRYIGIGVFSGCTSLNGFSGTYGGIVDGVMLVSGTGLVSCAAGPEVVSVTIPDSVMTIKWHAFFSCHSLRSVIIPDSVWFIESNAFQNCVSLQSVAIPDSVTSIEGGAFSGCTSLNGFSGTYGGIVDGVMLVSGTGLVSCAAGPEVVSVAIPDGVTYVGYCAFNCCEYLQSVVIPDSVKSIVRYAFYGCSSLQSVAIPDSVTSIGDSAFEGCSSLQSVAIPDSVTSIGGNAFGGLTFCGYDGGVLLQTAAELAGHVFQGSGDKVLTMAYQVSVSAYDLEL